MAQTAGPSVGKTHLESFHFGRRNIRKPHVVGFWLNRFQRGMVAKHYINPKNYYFADSLSATQIAALPEDVDGKNRLAAEQTLISNLYLCLGERGQDELY